MTSNENMKLSIKKLGMGIIEAQNEVLVLAGGMRSGSSPAGKTRLRYTIIDAKKWHELVKENPDEQLSQDFLYDESEAGFVELMVNDGAKDANGDHNPFDVSGLINIEVKKSHRKQGVARRVVQSIMATTGKDLEILDIKKPAASTWRKLGVKEFTDRSGKPLKISKVGSGHYIKGVINANEPESSHDKIKDRMRNKQSSVDNSPSV